MSVNSHLEREDIMSEELKEVELTLEGAVPTLTFEPFPESAPVAAAEPQKPAVPPEKPILDESNLSAEELRMVENFASQIDINNSNMILQYGAGAQKKMADFSETALNNVKTKDMGELGEMLSSVVMELKNFDAEEESKGFLGFFKKIRRNESKICKGRDQCQ